MYLTEILHETPPHCLDQKRFLDLLKALHPNSIESIDKVCCQEDKIGTRYCVADDFDQLGDFEERGERFHTFASGVFERLYPVETPPPPDLIHVTCTGYRSPSAAQVLVTRRGWEQDTTVTHAYHMGCLAALSAIRMGRGYLASGREGVDVVHTELSSLHFNGRLATNEQFVAQSLFADGLIKYTLTSAPKGPSFRILAQEEVMIRDSDELMKWETASWGLKMTLSKEIPKKIYHAIAPFVEKLVGERPLDEMIFAIHPGGPKIIDLIGRKLKLTPRQLEATYHILYTRGNMSSATLPHIWDVILNDPTYPDGTLCVGLAFGPGLTVSGILMEKCA